MFNIQKLSGFNNNFHPIYIKLKFRYCYKVETNQAKTFKLDMDDI